MAGPDSEEAQAVGELVGESVEPSVGEGFSAEAKGGGVWGEGGLALEEVVDAGVAGEGSGGGIPGVELEPLGRREQGQVGQGRVGLGAGGLEEGREVADESRGGKRRRRGPS